MDRLRAGRDRRFEGWRSGDRGADAGAVRRRSASPRRAAAAAAARPGPDRPGLSSGVAGWARRSRSTPTTSRRFGSRSPSGSPNSMRRQACPETGRFHAANGPGCAPRWRREFFAAEHGRPPQDARELAAAIAKHSRPQTTAVAGYDLTFSPVKSVSTLWALAEPAVAAQIEKAHRAAVADALASSNSTPCLAAPAPTGYGRSTCRGWSRPRSPTATAAPETPTCTPTSRSPTRSKPSTDAGSASTAGSCSKPPSPHRKPTTPP